MAARRRGKLLAGLGALLGIWTGGSGCQSLHLPLAGPPGPLAQASAVGPRFRAGAPDAPSTQGIQVVSNAVLRPGLECRWLVEAPQIQPSHRMAGTSQVGPDGTVEVGPYGSVRVAGLTPEQARQAIRKHLANYLSRPRVGLAVATAATPPPATTSAVQTVAWNPTPTASDDQSGGTSTWHPAQRVGEQPATTEDGVWHASAQVRLTSAPLQTVSTVPTQAAADSRGPAVEMAPAPNVVVDPPGTIVEHAGPPGYFPGHPPVPRELAKASLPAYVVEPPDILLVEVSNLPTREQQVAGQHLVRPDGTISLGVYGSLRVAGLTLEQIRDAVVQQLSEFKVKRNNINVDVLAYNSKFYYIIADGGGYGQQMFRLPITGNETVLDAISLIGGLPPISSTVHIWVARRNPGGFGMEKVLPVDWCALTQRGSAATNYQLMPGDRIFIKADKWQAFDRKVGKFLAPFERMLGFTLLGSETYNSIANRGASGGGSVP